MRIRPATSYRGHLRLPGDKSITHRAFLLGALAKGVSTVAGASTGDDCASTRRCLETLGTRFENEGSTIRIHGGHCFAQPAATLDCGNSGTTLRLLMGVLAGVAPAGTGIDAILSGDDSLNRRPMERVARPLREMGARMDTTSGFPPVRVRASRLRGASVSPEAASAQIKSAILLAALNAVGTTKVHELLPTRDHTERMIGSFGGQIRVAGTTIEIDGPQSLRAARVRIPGDPSSAAPFIIAALVLADSEVILDDVLLNPHRIRYLHLLREMGADITIEPGAAEDAEPRGRIVARTSELRAVTIAPADIPALIDELPLIAVAGAYARGRLEVGGASELRVKESDRIRSMVEGLGAMGARIEETRDGFTVEGGPALRGCAVASHGDHRIAMALSIAALGASGDTEVMGGEVVSISFPTFFDELDRGTAR